jgi:hypothetical protein
VPAHNFGQAFALCRREIGIWHLNGDDTMHAGFRPIDPLRCPSIVVAS